MGNDSWALGGGSLLKVALATAVTLASAQTATWDLGIVDGSLGGSFSSMRIDNYGNVHVAYVAEAQGLLQYSFWDHNLKKWFTTTIDKATGFCALVLDSKQKPHISYPQYGHLRYAFWDGSDWQKQTIPVPSIETTFYTSIALDATDNPSITYYENLTAGNEQVLRLRIVTFADKVWELTTIDQQRGSGKFNSVAIDSAGRPHVAYGNVQYENASLRYAYWNGERWHREILEGAGVPGTYRQAVMLILDKNDVPHISYSDALNQIVKYATRINGRWEFQSVDPIGMVAYPDRNGMALDDHGNPYISYYDGKSGVLKVAYRKEQRWVSEILDDGFAGFTSSIQIHDGTIWVTYSGGSRGGLRFARRPLGESSAGVPSQAK